MSLFQFGFTRNKANNNHKVHGDPEAEDTSKRRSKTDELSVTGNYKKSKRVHRYQPSWEKDFPWLGLDKDQNKMCCQGCRASPALVDVNSLFNCLILNLFNSHINEWICSFFMLTKLLQCIVMHFSLTG